MKLVPAIVAASALLSGVFVVAAENPIDSGVNPTIALVHGAFEHSHIWQGVETKLKAQPVVPVEHSNDAAGAGNIAR